MGSANTQRALAIVGFSLTWFFLQPSTLPQFFTFLDGGGAFYSLWYETLLALLVVVGLVAVALRRPLEKALGSHRIAAFSLIEVSAVGFILLRIAGTTPFPEVACLIAAVILALSSIALLFAWIYSIAHLESTEIALTVAASVAVYALLRLVGSWTGDFFDAIDDFFPCLSGLLWLLLADKGVQPTAVEYRASVLRELPLLTLGLLLLLLVCGRIVVGLFFDPKSPLPLDTSVIRSGIIVLLAAYLLAVFRRPGDKRRVIGMAWIPVAGVFFVGQMLVIAFGAEQYGLGTGIISASLMAIEALALIQLFWFAKEKNASPLLVVGLGFVAFRIVPIAIQRSFAPQLVALFNVSEGMIVLVIVMVIMMAMTGTLAFFYLFTLRASASSEGVGSTLTPRLACERLGEDAGLSPREIDVMALIAEGNSQKKISEELGISYGTVQWYAKSVYRKLDIHSKQDLIDLVGDTIKADQSAASA